MGAYDNPKIIQPPNYTEIFMKNFAGGQALVEKAFAGQKAKKKQKETKLDQAYQDASKIRVKGQAINAGDMTANVRKQTNLIADDFYANELAYIDEKIDRQTYQANRDKHLSKLQGMVDIGGELSKIDLENIKVSRHQADKGYALGLIEAYNNQAVDIDYSGDTAKLYYMNPNNERVEVDLNVLKDIKPADFGINEVFDFDKDKIEEITKSFEGQGLGAYKKVADDESQTIQVQTYGDGTQYASAEEAIKGNEEYEKNAIESIGAEITNLYNNLDSEDRGSLFADKAFASFTMGKNEGNKFQQGKEEEIEEILGGIDGMTDETIKHVKEQILNGTYNGTDEQLTAMDEVSKTMISKQLFYNNPKIKRPKTAVDKASADALKRKAVQDETAATNLKAAKKRLGDAESDSDEPIAGLNDYIKSNYNLIGTAKPSDVSAVINSFREPVKLVNGQEATLFNEDGSFKNTADLYATLRNVENKSFFNLPDGSFSNIRSVKEVASIIPAVTKIRNKEELTNDEKTLLKNFGFSDVVINSKAGINANITNVLKWAKSLDFNDPKTINGYIEIQPGSLKGGKKDKTGLLKDNQSAIKSNWKFVNSSEKNTTDLIKNNFRDRFAGMDPSVIARLVRDLQNNDSGLMKLLNN